MVKRLYTTFLLWGFLRLGTKLFSYVHERHNPMGRTTTMLFALNEREATITVRAFIEWLDEQYETQQRTTKTEN